MKICAFPNREQTKPISRNRNKQDLPGNHSTAISCNVVGVDFCGDLEEPWHGVVEEAFVGFAEVCFGCPVGVEGVLVFHAAAAAKVKVATEKALVAEISFSTGEVSLLL